ncbi:MAG: 30S ribosomal protein S1, partial [Chloroflexi bacterium]|nr:30S ribosomal protein S1 [Chloroflexota bacterium]
TGDRITGRVIRVDKEGVMVDIGYKSEGVIPAEELSHLRFEHPSEIVSEGQEVDVVVMGERSEDGNILLSKKRADLEQAWQRVIDAYEKGTVIEATCVEDVKGGLIIDLGLRGFLPASQVDIRPVRDLSEYVGEVLRVKILEVDRPKRKVVLTRRKVLIDEKEKSKSEVLKKIYEGAIIKGKVVRLTNFGAFVDLGGVDGLIHISELSWRRVKHPSEAVKTGQEVEVAVIKMDPKKERISLSLKQALPDPWTDVKNRFKEGSVFEGRVTKLAKKYAFIELAEGVEGVIPIVELAEGKLLKPEEVLKENQKVKVKVIEVRPDQRRIVLSLRQAAHEAEDGEYRKFSGTSSGRNFTFGEIVKAKMREGQTVNDMVTEQPVKKERDEASDVETPEIEAEKEIPALPPLEKTEEALPSPPLDPGPRELEPGPIPMHSPLEDKLVDEADRREEEESGEPTERALLEAEVNAAFGGEERE